MDSESSPAAESIPVRSGDAPSMDTSVSSGPLGVSPEPLPDDIPNALRIVYDAIARTNIRLAQIEENQRTEMRDIAEIKEVHVKLLQSAEAFASSPIARMMGGGGLSSIMGGNSKDE